VPRARTAKEALDTEIASLMAEGERLKGQIDSIEKDLGALNSKWSEKVARLEAVTREMEARNRALELLSDHASVAADVIEAQHISVGGSTEDAYASGDPKLHDDMNRPEEMSGLVDADEDDLEEEKAEAVEAGQPVPTIG
jgi:chromosome segregation ATPase